MSTLIMDSDIVILLQKEHEALKAEREDLLGQLKCVTEDAVSFAGQCTELRAQLAAAKAVLAEARPLVKGRLLDLDGQHGDASLLGRIAAVLEDKP